MDESNHYWGGSEDARMDEVLRETKRYDLREAWIFYHAELITWSQYCHLAWLLGLAAEV